MTYVLLGHTIATSFQEVGLSGAPPHNHATHQCQPGEDDDDEDLEQEDIGEAEIDDVDGRIQIFRMDRPAAVISTQPTAAGSSSNGLHRTSRAANSGGGGGGNDGPSDTSSRQGSVVDIKGICECGENNSKPSLSK